MPQHTQVSPEEELASYAVVPPWTTVAQVNPPVAPSATASAARADAPLAVASAGPSPVVAAVLSLFIPGAGQMLVGQVPKGAVLLVCAVFSVGFCGLLNLFAAVDAWRIAERRARGESVGDWQFL